MDDRFEIFGNQHLAVLVLFALGVVAVVALGRQVRGSHVEPWANRALALGIVAVTVPLQILQFTPDEWSLRTSLPFQLCDLAWVTAVHALWTRSVLTSTITYLWGITLTTQAIITPDLVTPFPEPRFLMFWATHMLVVWASFYLVLGVRILPTWRAYAQTIAATLVWAASVFVFNLFADTNYGYLNGKPAQASALDLLPPWPWYIAVQVVLISAVWALMVWPWTREEKHRSGRRGIVA
ncbi:TIGR02206 family membrane protein [Aeromicrobium sp. CTD01-1L150]|uniref:YwaF family protein n=1 Tax=Aeromicrobium sp. CTD01-1L150 TaxID=3341830 RepID=UPI0035C07D8B